MLTLTRKVGEGVTMGDARVVVQEIRKNQVRIGFDAPPDVPIIRHELIAEAGIASKASRSAMARVLRAVMAWCAANGVEFSELQEDARHA